MAAPHKTDEHPADEKPDTEEAAAPKAAAKTHAEPKSEPEIDPDDLIPRERLITDAQAFTGYPSHEVAGALSTEKAKSFTPQQAKQITREWLSKPEEV